MVAPVTIDEEERRRYKDNLLTIKVPHPEHCRQTKAFAKYLKSLFYIMDPIAHYSLGRSRHSPSNGVPMTKNELNSGKTVGHPATNISRHKRSHADMQLDNGESGEESEHGRHTKAFTESAECFSTTDLNLTDITKVVVESGFPFLDMGLDWNFDEIGPLVNGYSPLETNEDQIEMEEEGGVTGVGLAEDKAAAGKPDATECSNVTSEDGNGVGLVGDKSDDTSPFLDKRQSLEKHDPIPSTSSNYDMETERIGVTSVNRNVTAQKTAPRLEWTNKGTEQLIALFKNNIPHMTENPTEKRQVYEDIATDLQEIMPGVTSQQVSIKWKNLKDLPKKLDDGKVKKEPPYYNLLCSVLKLLSVNPLPSLKAGPSTETINRSAGFSLTSDLDSRLVRNPGETNFGTILPLYNIYAFPRTLHILEKTHLIVRKVKSQLGRHPSHYTAWQDRLITTGMMIDKLFDVQMTYTHNIYDERLQLVEAKNVKTNTLLYSLQYGIDIVAQQHHRSQKDYDMFKESIKKLVKGFSDDWYEAAAEESNDLAGYIKVQMESHKVESFMDTFISKLDSNLGKNTFKMQPETIEKLLNTFTSKVESLVKLEETFQRKEFDLHQKTLRQNEEYIETLKGYDQELNRLGVVKEAFQCKCIQQVLKPLTTRACAV